MRNELVSDILPKFFQNSIEKNLRAWCFDFNTGIINSIYLFNN